MTCLTTRLNNKVENVILASQILSHCRATPCRQIGRRVFCTCIHPAPYPLLFRMGFGRRPRSLRFYGCGPKEGSFPWSWASQCCHQSTTLPGPVATLPSSLETLGTFLYKRGVLREAAAFIRAGHRPSNVQFAPCQVAVFLSLVVSMAEGSLSPFLSH